MNRNLVSSQTKAKPRTSFTTAFLCIAAIFAVPAFGTIILASWDGEFSYWQQAARIFFLPTLFLEMVIIFVAIAKGMQFSKFVWKLPKTTKVLLASWISILLISTIWADANKDMAVLGASFWLVHLLFFISILFLVAQTGIAELRLEILAVILPFAALVAGLIIFVFASFKGLDANIDWISGLPGFANVRHTGYMFAPAIAVSLASLAARPSEFVRTHMLLVTVNTGLMLWLGSRGPVFGLLVALMICTACFPMMRNIKFISKAAFAGTLGALMSIFAPVPQTDVFGAVQRFWNGSSDPTAFSTNRLDFWSETIDLIIQRPFTGYGALQFQYISENAAGVYKHPHNSILQIMFEWGVIGGALFIGLMTIAIYAAFFQAKCSPYVKLLSGMGFITMTAFSFIDGLFFYSQPIAVSIIFLVIPIATGFSWSVTSSQR